MTRKDTTAPFQKRTYKYTNASTLDTKLHDEPIPIFITTRTEIEQITTVISPESG